MSISAVIHHCPGALRAMATILVVQAMSAVVMRAQTDSVDCLSEFRGLAARMYEMMENPDRIYHIEYRTTTISIASGRRDTTVTLLRLNARASRFHVMNGEVDVQQDDSMLVVVTPARKSISIQPVRFNSGILQQQLQSMLGLYDTLARMSDRITCREVEVTDGKSIRRLTLELNSLGKRVFRETTVAYDFSVPDGRIEKLTLQSAEGQRGRTKEVVIAAIDSDYDDDTIDSPVDALFFDSERRLLPEYSDYLLIDSRAGAAATH